MSALWRRGTPRVPRTDAVSPTDFFGLHNEARIVASKVRDIFTPYQPVQRRDLLFGRKAEVVAAIEALNTPGRHVFICGERGVGKTSLASVVTNVLRDATTTPVPSNVKRCDSEDTFETLLERPLTALGVDVHRVESTVQRTQTRKTDISASYAGFGQEQQFGVSARYEPNGRVGAAEAAEHLKGTRGLLVVDETDAIADPAVLGKVAVLIKHLSDIGSPFKVLVVGTDRMTASLMDTYPPVRQCLKTINLPVLSLDDLTHLLRAGAKALGLTFTNDVVDGITRASAGLPHFAHRLALTCAENAVTGGRREVTINDLAFAMATAISEVDPGLTEKFLDAVDGDLDSSAVDVLKKAAATDGPEFESDTANQAFESVRPRVYRFADSRMRPYLRIRYPFD